MSGGHFDYAQYRINDIVTEIKKLIEHNEDTKKKLDNGEKVTFEWGYDGYITYNDLYSERTIEEFKTGMKLLRKAEIYAQRIDWLVCDDDGEETFHERLKEELDKLGEEVGGE